MNCADALQLATDHLIKQGLTDWRVILDKHPNRRAGQCRYRRKEIGLTRGFVQNNDRTTVENVILHEIAHALTEGHHHDEVWRQKAIELGSDGEIFYNTNKVVSWGMAKGILLCIHCGHESPVYNKHQATAETACAMCDPKKFNENYLMEYIPMDISFNFTEKSFINNKNQIVMSDIKRKLSKLGSPALLRKVENNELSAEELPLAKEILQKRGVAETNEAGKAKKSAPVKKLEGKTTKAAANRKPAEETPEAPSTPAAEENNEPQSGEITADAASESNEKTKKKSTSKKKKIEKIGETKSDQIVRLLKENKTPADIITYFKDQGILCRHPEIYRNKVKLGMIKKIEKSSTK